MESESAKVAAKNSFLYFSVSGPEPVASLRDSHASSEVSPPHPRFYLLPDHIGERLGNPRALNHRVADIDIKLKRDRKLVIHQTCGDEDALRIAKVKVAMAHSVIAEGNIVAVGNQGFLPLANRQRNKIIGLALQRGRGSARHGSNHSLQVGFGDRDLTGNRIADTIWRL